MSDLRDLLQQGAGDRPGPPDMTNIRRRGNALVRRRRALIGACAAVAALALGLGLPHLPSHRTMPAKRTNIPLVAVGPLEAGQYLDRDLQPQVTFTVPDTLAWRVLVETSASLILRADQGLASVSLQRWTQIYRPGVDPASAAAASDVPVNLMGWIQRHPELQIQEAPVATALAGHPAHRIQFTVRPHRIHRPGQPVGCNWASDCVLLGDTDDQVVTAPADAITQITVPDSGADRVILTVSISEQRRSPDEAAVRELTDSIRTFTLSKGPSG